MKAIKKKAKVFARRKMRIRTKIKGTASRPRLSVFKSHKYIYAQIIDDERGHTLVSFDSRTSKAKSPVMKAEEVGLGIAEKAKAAKITKVVFDRSGYLYTGKIKIVADSARKGGLEF